MIVSALHFDLENSTFTDFLVSSRPKRGAF